MKSNIFIEGLQGSGKSELVEKILMKSPNLERDSFSFEGLSLQQYQSNILDNLKKYKEMNHIFENQLFGEIIDVFKLHYHIRDEEIIKFYLEIKKILKSKKPTIYFLVVKDINVRYDDIIAKKIDENGQYSWFENNLTAFENSAYCKDYNITGKRSYIEYLENKQELMIRIINQYFSNNTIVLLFDDYKL